MAKLFKTAFAYQGTKEQLPDSAQPDGKASFAEGFTDDYALNYGDADARDIAQSELNGIFHDVTGAIGELQKYGVAVWQPDMAPIAKYSLVFHGDKLWQAKTNTSTQPAQGANWQQVDIADIASQLASIDLSNYATKTYAEGLVAGLASKSYVDAGLATKATARVVNAQLAGKFDKTDVVQESGQSTTKVMSQKAVTDALSDAAAGQLSWGAITGDIENQGDLQDALSTKVNKEAGKVLSTNDYSDEDKAKLTSLEGSHFRGVYINEAALSEITDPVAGDYADVDTGEGSDAKRWIYDASDDKWVTQESATSLTASQVKQLYESNADTNAFTDDDKSKLTALKTTVPQAEAEAGTSTNIRAWTAQRVRQAITAWWDTIGTAFGKTLLGSTDASAARGSLELGTAATSSVVQDTGQSNKNVMSQKAVTDALVLAKTFTPWQPEVIEGTGSPVNFTLIPGLSVGGGYSQNENVFTFSPTEAAPDDGYFATWKANAENVPEKYSITLNKVSTETNAPVVGFYSGVAVGGWDPDNEIYPTVVFNYTGADDNDPALLTVDNYFGGSIENSIVDPDKTIMTLNGFGAITAPMPSQGMDVTLAIDNSALSASIFYDGVLQGTVYLLEPLIPDSIWVSTYGLVSGIGETATVTLVDRVVEDYIPFTIYGFGDSAIDESKYPQNREGKGYEIIDLAAPAYWNELGKEVKNGDFIVFDNAGMPKEVGEEVDLSDYATKTYVDNAVNEIDLSEYTKRSADETITGDWEFTGGISVGDAKFGAPFKPNWSPTEFPAAFSFNSTENASVNLFDAHKGVYYLTATRTGTDYDGGSPIDSVALLISAQSKSGDMASLALAANDSGELDTSIAMLKNGISYALGVDKNGKGYLSEGATKKYLATEDFVKDSKTQVKEIVTANKTLTAADSGKLLIINADGITITLPASSDFNVDIAKMDESFITIVQGAGTDKFREGTATISVIRDVSITNSGIPGKEWLAIGAYEV